MSYYKLLWIGENRARANIKKFVLREFPTLDKVVAHSALAIALDVPCSAEEICSGLIKRKISLSIIPDGHPLFFDNSETSPSRYFLKEIVGKQRKKRNLIKHLQENFVSIEGLTDTDSRCETFLSILGVYSIRKLKAFAIEAEVFT